MKSTLLLHLDSWCIASAFSTEHDSKQIATSMMLTTMRPSGSIHAHAATLHPPELRSLKAAPASAAMRGSRRPWRPGAPAASPARARWPRPPAGPWAGAAPPSPAQTVRPSSLTLLLPHVRLATSHWLLSLGAPATSPTRARWQRPPGLLARATPPSPEHAPALRACFLWFLDVVGV